MSVNILEVKKELLTQHTHQTKHHKLWSWIERALLFLLVGCHFFTVVQSLTTPPPLPWKMNDDCAIYSWLDPTQIHLYFQLLFLCINVAVLVCCWSCLMFGVSWHHQIAGGMENNNKKYTETWHSSPVHRYVWNLIFSLLLFRD